MNAKTWTPTSRERIRVVPRAIDIAGTTSGRLTAIAFSHRNQHRQKVWRCRCECGNEVLVTTSTIKRQLTQSCGCLQKEIARDRCAKNRPDPTTHGLSHTPEYQAWTNMRYRCEKEETRECKNYGGRGIKVCDRWQEFENFLEDMGNRPSKDHSLDRIDVNGNYEPQNCRWSDRATQSNNKRTNRMMTFVGETLTLTEWARRLSAQTGIPESAMAIRLQRGWSYEAMIHYPHKGHKKRRDSA